MNRQQSRCNGQKESPERPKGQVSGQQVVVVVAMAVAAAEKLLAGVRT